LVRRRASAVALPAELVDSAREYARDALAKRTQAAYARAWAGFEAWCAEKSAQSLPAAPETIAVWMAALANGESGRKPLSRSSIHQAFSAVILYHRDAGHALDRKHKAINKVWRGICNNKARTETKRQALALIADDLQALLNALRPEIPAEARDAALLAVG